MVSAALETEDDNYIGSTITEDDAASSSVRSKPEKWSVEDVCKWIVEIGLDEYKENFKQHHIDGMELLTLNTDTLKTGLQIG